MPVHRATARPNRPSSSGYWKNVSSFGCAKPGPRLSAAVDRFVEHHHELREPTKRLYDYFNSRGHGGYYYFFAHWHAVEAARELPAAKRKKALEAIRKELLSCRELDGTWVDHAMLGRAYGTAQALRILAALDAQ